MSKSNKLLFSQGIRETTETKPPSFIHKYRELARVQAGLCARHLFSFQDQASSPAGREMSCRDAIVGHSASREWTAEIQSRFSFFFLAQNPQSPLWPDSKRLEKGGLGCCARVHAGHRGSQVHLGPGRPAAWLSLVCSAQGERMLVSMALLPLVLVGEEVQSAFQLRNH